jgi:hypothetical protein
MVGRAGVVGRAERKSNKDRRAVIAFRLGGGRREGRFLSDAA